MLYLNCHTLLKLILVLRIKNALLKNFFFLFDFSCKFAAFSDNSWTTMFSVKNHKSNSKIRILNFVFSSLSWRNFCRLWKSRCQLQQVTIDADRLKFFTTKVEIWEYAKIPASDFQKLSFDDKASILKHYYSDMSAKYSVSAAILFIYLFFYSGSCASYFLQQNCYSAH